jgi:hypothetical protein
MMLGEASPCFTDIAFLYPRFQDLSFAKCTFRTFRRKSNCTLSQDLSSYLLLSWWCLQPQGPAVLVWLQTLQTSHSPRSPLWMWQKGHKGAGLWKEWTASYIGDTTLTTQISLLHCLPPVLGNRDAKTSDRGGCPEAWVSAHIQGRRDRSCMWET